MNEKELLYIKTIVEEKSISKAAKKLYIAQPSLSQALQRIEGELNTSLFTRSCLGLIPTLSGNYYYQTANQILRIYEDMKNQIKDINNLQAGSIKLGITSHLGSILLPDAVSDFMNSYPNIKIDISEKSSLNLYEDIISGNIDFAIMHKIINEDMSGIDFERLLCEDFIVIANKSFELSNLAKDDKNYEYKLLDLKHLKDLKLIMLDKSQRIREVVDIALNNAKISKENIIIQTKNYNTALYMVSKNIGVTILPPSYIKNIQSNDIEIFSIPKIYKARWIMGIAYIKSHFLSKADLAFIEIIKRHTLTTKGV